MQFGINNQLLQYQFEMEANSGKSVCKQYVIHNLLLYLCFEFRIEYDCNYLSTIIYTELLRADKETLAEAMKKKWCGNCKTETFYWYGCRNATYCTRCNDRQKGRKRTCCFVVECPLKRMWPRNR